MLWRQRSMWRDRLSFLCARHRSDCAPWWGRHTMSARPQHEIGYRAAARWGERPDVLSEYASGDLVYIPPGSNCLLEDRVSEAGLYRVVGVFSIGEDASWYYRVSPCEIRQGRGLKLELVTDWLSVSDRIHVIPGNVDMTAGWVRLYSAVSPVFRAAGETT